MGLTPGGMKDNYRNHVHFATRSPIEGKVISGMRSDCEVALYVDMRRAMQDGIQFFRSSNGVLLSVWIDPKYFEKEMHLKRMHNAISKTTLVEETTVINSSSSSTTSPWRLLDDIEDVVKDDAYSFADEEADNGI